MKRMKKEKGCGTFVIVLILLISIGIVGVRYLTPLQEKLFFQKGKYVTTYSAPSLSDAPNTALSLLPEQLYSSSAILIRLDDHSILMQKSSEDKIYPASLTKMMTAIIAIKELPDLQEKVKLSPSIFKELKDTNASTAGFLPDEEVSALDLLYGALLPSGAECCIGLADKAAGSEQSFVGQMNQKAKALGMTHTHFVNVTGLQNENHYTTVNDLAILLSYALQDSTFREIFTASLHSIPPTNKHPKGVTLHSTLSESLNDPNVADGKILGGKTGYTEEAGLCLASLAKIGKQEYILITAGAQGDHKTEQYDIRDALTVYNSLRKK